MKQIFYLYRTDEEREGHRVKGLAQWYVMVSWDLYPGLVIFTLCSPPSGLLDVRDGEA